MPKDYRPEGKENKSTLRAKSLKVLRKIYLCVHDISLRARAVLG